jgi:hypothetical protein
MLIASLQARPAGADPRVVERPHGPILLAGGIALLAAIVFALAASLGTDYAAGAGVAIGALRRTDLAGFFGNQPGMGQLSLWLRWPAAQVPSEILWQYRAGALMCLLFPVGLAAYMARRTTTVVAVLVAGAVVANPVTIRALELGHPEEAMCAALCVGGVLLLLDGRTGWGSVALGLAIATKQWALLAVVPGLIAIAPEARRRALGTMAAIAALFTLPALIADTQSFFQALDAPTSGVAQLRPGNFWSLVIGPSAEISLGADESAQITLVPDWLRTVAHPAIFLAGVGLPLLMLWRGTARSANIVLGVLALVFLARCALDPWNHEYYHLPFLMVLAAWEVRVVRRAPVLALASTAILWLVFGRLVDSGHPVVADVVYMTWAAVLGGWLLVRVLQPFSRRAAALQQAG